MPLPGPDRDLAGWVLSLSAPTLSHGQNLTKKKRGGIGLVLAFGQLAFAVWLACVGLGMWVWFVLMCFSLLLGRVDVACWCSIFA